MKTNVGILFVMCLLCAAAVFSQTPSCCAPAPPGLIDWWTFDEPAGPLSSDIDGAVNNVGTDNGPITRVGGIVGRATSYNGVSTWIVAKNDQELNFAGDCSNDVAEPATIDFWIRTTQKSGTLTILDKRDRTSPSFLRGYSVYLWNGQVGFQMATGSGNSSCNSPGSACSNFTSPLQVADGQWKFVAIAFTRCKGATGLFYVNGQTSSFTPRVGDITSKSDLFIGRTVPALGKSFFRGSLDELEYFKSALAKQELDTIYQAGPAGKCRRFWSVGIAAAEMKTMSAEGQANYMGSLSPEQRGSFCDKFPCAPGCGKTFCECFGGAPWCGSAAMTEWTTAFKTKPDLKPMSAQQQAIFVSSLTPVLRESFCDKFGCAPGCGKTFCECFGDAPWCK